MVGQQTRRGFLALGATVLGTGIAGRAAGRAALGVEERDEEGFVVTEHALGEHPREGFSGPTVVGVARNRSDDRLAFTELTVEYLDGDGEVVGTGLDTRHDVLPGQGFVFAAPPDEPLDGPVAEYDLQTASETAEDGSDVSTRGNDLLTLVEHGRRERDGVLEIRGVAENAAEERLEFASVYVRYVGGDDTIVGTGAAVESDLPADADWEFVAPYRSPVDVPARFVDSYEIWAEGTR